MSTQRSCAVAVLLSVDPFERMTYEPKVPEILAKGETDIRKASEVSVGQALVQANAPLGRRTPCGSS